MALSHIRVPGFRIGLQSCWGTLGVLGDADGSCSGALPLMWELWSGLGCWLWLVLLWPWRALGEWINRWKIYFFVTIAASPNLSPFQIHKDGFWKLKNIYISTSAILRTFNRLVCVYEGLKTKHLKWFYFRNCVFRSFLGSSTSLLWITVSPQTSWETLCFLPNSI